MVGQGKEDALLQDAVGAGSGSEGRFTEKYGGYFQASRLTCMRTIVAAVPYPPSGPPPAHAPRHRRVTCTSSKLLKIEFSG
jgi:hypothetical protein